mgnify:CR=1 FL=1
MPVYGGGKARLGKEIHNVIKLIEAELNWGTNHVYFEPFCGLLGVQIHFAKENRKCVACDANANIIKLFSALKEGWIPPEKCDEKTFDKLKKSDESSALKGFVGVACSYSGIYFSGYRTKAGTRDYIQNSKNGFLKMVPYLQSIKFMKARDYRKFKPVGMTIYCDPPYKGNGFHSEYFVNFDSKSFWDTMREWSKNNLVIISEYEAPKDFICVWRKQMKSNYNISVIHRTEKLFIYSDSLSETD